MPHSAPPRRWRLTASSLEISILDWGGAGSPVLLHHANGFGAALWDPVARALGDGFRVLALDARGHGESEKPEPPDAYRWEACVADLSEVAEQLVEVLGRPFAVAAGHSFGGTATLAAAAGRSELFERLLLIDPVVFPPEPLGPAGERRRALLAAAARRRRDVFPSRAAALRSWRRRRFFARWEPRALELYADSGLRERPGGGVELQCPKEIEAAIFAQSGTLDLFALAPGVPQPLWILWAREGSFQRELFEALAARAPRGRVLPVDAGHLVPMEQPRLVADALRRLAREPL